MGADMHTVQTQHMLKLGSDCSYSYSLSSADSTPCVYCVLECEMAGGG